MEQPQVFKKRPVEVSAIQYTGENIDKIREWFTDCKMGMCGGKLYIETLEGEMTVTNGDWIIRGVDGEYYPCKPDIFEKTYRLNSYKKVTKDLKYIMKTKY